MSYRILSLDGGGIRGVFTTTVLARLEQAVPGFLGKVDLFAGTSTGAIVAAGLAAGMTPDELTRLYLEHGKDIFADTFLDDVKDLGKVKGADYDNARLAVLVADVFEQWRGIRTLGDLHRRILIPAFDLDTGDDPGFREGDRRTWKPKFFHNFPGGDSDGAERIVNVLLRTSAGPTYFPTYDGYIDGGVVANNPSVAALAQALHPGTGKQRLEDVVLLNIGTGQSPAFIAGKRHDWGYLQWAKPLARLILEGAADTARYQCEQILADRYRRVDAMLDRPIGLDEVKYAPDLVEVGRHVPLDEVAAWVGRWFG